MISKKESFEIFPLGYIRRDSGKIFLELKDKYISGLKGLDDFSHILVFWWFSKLDNKENRNMFLCHPPHDAPETGVFACRSPRRPNPIALTVAKIIKIDFKKGLIYINNIDAEADSPFIDIKGYFPSFERVKEYKIPKWAKNQSEWYPEEGKEIR